MDMSFPKYQATLTKHENNLEFTMDYDSGYVSHNPESNLDSSSESLNDKMTNCVPDKPIYLCEDALLEIPEINKFHNLSVEIDKEDYEETRKLFNSPSPETSTIVTNSTESHEMNYSGFSESSVASDIEIPNVDQIIIDNLDTPDSVNRVSNGKSLEHTFCSDSSEECFRGFTSNTSSTTAFHNITNTLATNDPRKKLTLIFSKCDKENVYSVKRKYRSMTPDKSMTPSPQRKFELRQSEHFNSQQKFDPTDNNVANPIDKETSISDSQVSETFNVDVQKNDFSFKFSSVDKYEYKNSNLLSECLKKFGETCFVNEDMYIQDEIEDTREEFSMDSPKQNKEGILDASIDRDYQNLSDTKIEIDIPDHSVPLSKNSEKQSQEIVENYEDPKLDMYENNDDSAISMKPEIAEPTISFEGARDVSIEQKEYQNLSDTKVEMDIPDLSFSRNSEKQIEVPKMKMNDNLSLHNNDVSANSMQSDFPEPIITTANVPISAEINTDIQESIINNTTDLSDSCVENIVHETKENENIPAEKDVKIEKPIIDTFETKTLTSETIQSEKISTTPKKKFKNSFDPNLSPDLFEDYEIEEKAKIIKLPTHIAEEKFIHRKDRSILRRAQNNLKGVIPPHSMTVFNISVDEMLNRFEHNSDYFWKKGEVNQNESVSDKNKVMNSDTSIKDEVSKSLLITCSEEEFRNKKFPDILEDRCHGLYFNRSKLSEEFEDLCVKYSQRYVGAETQSSCTVFEISCSSPMKRKQIKQRWAVKSPGRRLSHLAKRRITFSSATLQTGSSLAGSRTRQILVDAKKLELLNRRKSPRKTPKKTPGKSPRIKTRTPSSSAKKKLALKFRKLTGEIEKTVSISSDLSSKRALFQSPERDKNSILFLPSTSGISAFPIDTQKPSTKRALFLSPNKKPSRNSPFKRSPFRRLDLGEERKRKRTDSDEFHPNKLSRSVSMDIRPSGSENRTLNRAKSDMSICQVGELSAVHKKKLQWAVYEALRSQAVTPDHPHFKLHASVLARVTRRLLPDLSGGGARADGGTSDVMRRLARHHVYAVLKGKSADEIYGEHVRARARRAKPHGYVAPEEYEKRAEGGGRGTSASGGESKIERIRKVINFGDDDG